MVQQQCTICIHPQRTEIDQAITRGDAHRAIARQFGVSRHALDRHKKNGHIAQQIAKAAEAKEIAQAENLLSKITTLQETADRILDKAEKAGDIRAACAAIREVRGVLELMAKVTGELKGDGVTVNIIQSAEFQQVIAILQEELPDEIRERFARRLYEIGA